MRFSKRKLHFCFCLFTLVKEKQKKEINGKGQKNLYKYCFLRWSSKNERNKKNGFLAKIA